MPYQQLLQCVSALGQYHAILLGDRNTCVQFAQRCYGKVGQLGVESATIIASLVFITRAILFNVHSAVSYTHLTLPTIYSV